MSVELPMLWNGACVPAQGWCLYHRAMQCDRRTGMGAQKRRARGWLRPHRRLSSSALSSKNAPTPMMLRPPTPLRARFTPMRWLRALLSWWKAVRAASEVSGVLAVASSTSPGSLAPRCDPASDAPSPTVFPQTVAAILRRPVHRDHRGFVYEAWRESSDFGCKQVTVVGCQTGLWKGLHLHPSKHSIWFCAAGRLLCRVGDNLVALRAGDGLLVSIPPHTPHDVMGLARRNVLVELDDREFVEGDKVRI